MSLTKKLTFLTQKTNCSIDEDLPLMNLNVKHQSFESMKGKSSLFSPTKTLTHNKNNLTSHQDANLDNDNSSLMN